MTLDRDKSTRELLAFYQEAGVDALLGETAVDRFADEALVNAVAAPAAPAPTQASTSPTQAPPIAQRAAAPPGERTIVYARDLDNQSKTGAAPPPPDAAVMAAREAARSAASLDELRAILMRFDGCAL